MANREKRKQIAEENLKIMKIGYYKKYDILQDVATSTMDAKFYSEEVLDEIVLKQTSIEGDKNIVTVTQNDVVKELMTLKEKYPTEKIAVLNCASARNAGGGFLNGSLSQEEALAYASTMFGVLKDRKDFYKNPKHLRNGLYSHSMIYAPNVVFIRDENHVLVEPYLVDMIVSTAVNLGDLKEKGLAEEVKQANQVMRERIERIVALAKENKVEVLVLGAFGCGVFKNNPYVVSNIFKEVLNMPAYRSAFKEVVFPIYDSNKDTSTYQIFKGI